jgi:hypothetical protein
LRKSATGEQVKTREANVIMSKRVLSICLLAAALCARPALAAQNVANTSQKGSLLIFPAITVDPEDVSNTFIEVSNDETGPVHIECSYINEGKGRVDFDFTLTAKATASWDAATGSGIGAPPFPTNASPVYAPIPANLPRFFAAPDLFRGELVCFATDAAGANQVAFNHLTGTATVVNTDDADAIQIKQAYRYNAWSFIARNVAGLPEADNVIQGTPGLLALTGGLAGTYDACPAYNIASFNPNGAVDPTGTVTTIDNDLSLVSCNQDLRQDFFLHLTKAQFTVWNANENSFTGAFQCIDSVQTIGLGAADNTIMTARSNFDEATLRTPNARFQVSGISSVQCPTSYILGPGLPVVPVPATENAGLLGVITSSLGIDEAVATNEDDELGSTTQTAGSMVGFVKWDPAGGTVPAVKTHS